MSEEASRLGAAGSMRSHPRSRYLPMTRHPTPVHRRARPGGEGRRWPARRSTGAKAPLFGPSLETGRREMQSGR
jgi:hypothetical protein